MKHRIKPRGRVSTQNRPSPRLQLEALEGRLPLGDALLSTLLGSSLLASNLSRDDSSYWPSAGAPTAAFQVNHRRAHLGTGSVLETDNPGTAPNASCDPFPLQGPPSEAEGGNARTSAVHVVAKWDSDFFRWSSTGALFGTGDDLASDLSGDPLRGSVLSWDAAAVTTRHHLAGSSAEEGGSPDGGRASLAAPSLAPRTNTGDLRAAQPPAGGAGASSGPSAADLIGELSSESKNDREGPIIRNAYVMNGDSNNVSVIDTGSNTVIDTVAVGMRPLRAAITPDGASVYLVNFLSNSVSVIETVHNTVVDTISVGTGPQAIAMTPDGAFAYTVNNISNNVSVIDTAHNSVVDTIDVGTRPVGIAITPDGAFAYVANSGSANISVIETGHDTVFDTIKVGPGPFTLTITPDGAFAYVTQAGSVADPGTTVTVVETTSHKVVQSVKVGQFPVGVAITPDGAFAYVANQGLTKDDTAVSVIETATNTVVKTVEVGHNPIGVAITDDGAFVYVTNSGAPFGQPASFPGTISVIDTRNNTVVAEVDVGTRPAGVAIMPSQA
jgi:YVTN family beta-propeller protein